MRIGFAAIHSWRPHVEHLHYLAGLAREAGHSASFLACDGDLAACHTKELRPERSDLVHCLRCRMGSIRSYERTGVAAIGRLADSDTNLGDSSWSQSSAASLGRFESSEDLGSEAFKRLAARLDRPTRQAHAAALRWIERERLDAVCLFNGRIDATRGVLEAAVTTEVPFVSLERTWFGDGLHLLPNENCLGLHAIDHMMAEWRDVPLARVQALRAAGHVASRFLRQNNAEWRAYNLVSSPADWPHRGASRRVLLLPSSRNETFGHTDWASGWVEPTAAYDALMERFAIQPDELVLRCHPNWGERIGSQDGQRIERYYKEWAARRGVTLIASTEPTSTLGLIALCDAVVVGGSTAALEAGILGKQVIATTPSMYQRAGFQCSAYDADSLEAVKLHAERPSVERAARQAAIARQTLRFAYTMIYRVPHYVEQVRCITTTRYEYREGADPGRLIALLQGGRLQPDDGARADDCGGEDEVLRMIAAHEWSALLASSSPTRAAPRREVHRRWMLRPIDGLRELLPRGDL